MGLAVVIVTWNSQDDILPCLESLAASTLPPDEVVIVDSRSSDGTVGMVSGWNTTRMDVRLIACDHNVGYARGTNIGVRATLQDTVFLLNPDTVVDTECIGLLADELRAAGNRDVVCGPTLIGADGLVQWACHRDLPRVGQSVLEFYRDGSRYARQGGVEHLPSTSEPECLSGAACVLTRELFYRLGQLDEGAFMYHEDILMCHFLKQLGGRVRHVRDAVVVHKGGASADKVQGKEQLEAHLLEAMYRYFGVVSGRAGAGAYRMLLIPALAARTLLIYVGLALPSSMRPPWASRVVLSRTKGGLLWCLGLHSHTGDLF